MSKQFQQGQGGYPKKRFNKPGGFGNKPSRYIPPMSQENIELLKIINDKTKVFAAKINDLSTKMDNKESEFREENIGKEITVITSSNYEEIKGKLLDIDKYKLILEVENSKKYFYKHALIGYYSE